MVTNPLVVFFREEEIEWGLKGDYEGWSPEQSAIELIRLLRAVAGDNWSGNPAVVERDREWIAAIAAESQFAMRRITRRLEAAARKVSASATETADGGVMPLYGEPLVGLEPTTAPVSNPGPSSIPPLVVPPGWPDCPAQDDGGASKNHPETSTEAHSISVSREAVG